MTAWKMKIAVEIAKVVQFGAGAGVVLATIFMGAYRQQERGIVEIFGLVCVALALVCPVFLWVMGERTRAWKGLVSTMVLAMVAAVLSAPMVIR
jgi:predicted membrane protein